MIRKVNRKVIYLLSKLKKNLNAFRDYKEYTKNIVPYSNEAKELVSSCTNNKYLLMVSGRGMNITWAQMWTILSLSAFRQGYKVAVLTSKNDILLNLYFSLMPIEKIYFEDFEKEVNEEMPFNISEKIANLISFDDYKTFYYEDSPIGQIALSTYSRHIGTGLIEIEKPSVKALVDQWLAILIRYTAISESIYDKYNVKALFMTEVFLEEYGALYYTAINKGLNVIRMTGTVRDDSILLMHLSKKNDRYHQGSITESSFEIIKTLKWDQEEEQELHQNFMDRYGEKWHRSKRNQLNTVFMSPEAMRSKYAISDGKKVAVIYSHILYDSLFFFGTDLFSSYAEWLIESVKAACKNDKVEWFVKVHPSNIWRGELKSMLKGKYEEERLIEIAIGTLPPHVRIIPADNDGISPYSWFQFADYGITVRGTSGLEMAALGQTVICAGTGRYEGNGFTVDPYDKDEYLAMLANIQNLPSLTEVQKILAKKYAHAIFVRKPFCLTSFMLKPKKGIKKVLASDDIVYIPSEKYAGMDIAVVAEWLEKTDRLDLLKGIDYDF